MGRGLAILVGEPGDLNAEMGTTALAQNLNMQQVHFHTPRLKGIHWEWSHIVLRHFVFCVADGLGAMASAMGDDRHTPGGHRRDGSSTPPWRSSPHRVLPPPYCPHLNRAYEEARQQETMYRAQTLLLCSSLLLLGLFLCVLCLTEKHSINASETLLNFAATIVTGYK